MAQCKLTPHEFIQNAFSPMVAVICSPLVDHACQKNNLSFIEMIQPFCKLNTEAHFREPSGTSITVRNLRITMQDINSRPPQPTLARKLLNESVSSHTNERNTSLQIGGQTIDIPASVPWFEAWRETFLQVQFPSDHEFTKHYIACVLVVSSAENNPMEALQHMCLQLQQAQNMNPGKLPKWFGPNVLQFYVLVHDALEGDNDKAVTTYNNIKQTYGDNNCYFLQINSRPLGQTEDQSHLPDPWSQFLIRQLESQETSEQESSPRTPAEIGGVTGMPSCVTADNSCDNDSADIENVMRPGVGSTVVMSSLEVAQEAGESAVPVPVPVTVTHHPLSPDVEPQNFALDASDKSKNQVPINYVNPAPSHINANVWASQAPPTTHHGAYLTSNDLECLRMFVQEFCIKALLPYIERQIQQLSEIISNKKGVSRSLISATKRWFGSNKPGLPGSNTPVNAIIYTSDAPELQLRRLGDMCFMFGHYSLAFQAYHSAKRDFNADQAWLYYAGALEMAALSAFMQGEVTRKAQEYMDEGIVTYFNSCKMPQFATRATLLSTECLKGRSLYGEAAKQFIRMTSEDSDLRSALLLEQASYCFLKATKPKMLRKYAFHIVLAGHRFSKAGQRKHSLRCYKQAYQVYENKNWSLAEDHIHFTIGRQASNLKHTAEAAAAFAKILNPTSRQSAAQQAAFLREFLTTQQQLFAEEGVPPKTILPILPLPLVDDDMIYVLLGSPPPLPFQDGTSFVVPATGVTFSDDNSDGIDTRWAKLEELLIAEAQGSAPMIFKPTPQIYSKFTNNSSKPVAIVGEPVTVRVILRNPLHISLVLNDVRLLWKFSKASEVVDNETMPETPKSPVETQHLDVLMLKPDCSEEVVLYVIPRLVGELNILGIAYHVSNPTDTVNNSTTNPVSIQGKQVFNIRGPKPKSTKDKVSDLQDRRLQINAVESAPCLQVTFRDLSSEMLCGEFQQVSIHFLNVGQSALQSLYVASSSPQLYSLGEQKTGQVTHIPLPTDSLAPGQSHAVSMWLRAPDTVGTTNLEMLFYYENVNSNSVPRHRLVRHLWQITVLSSIQLTTTALRSTAADGNGIKEILNLTMSVKNCNQVHDSLMSEISLLQISLASRKWQLSKKITMPEDVKLQSQELVHLVVQAHRNEEESNDHVFSDVAMNQIQNLPGPLSKSPYIDFYKRHRDEKSKNMKGPQEAAESETREEQGDKVKDMEAALRFDATLILRWKAYITDSGGIKRTAIGQHHLTIEKIGTAITWPVEPVAPLLNQEPVGPLKIFGRDDTSVHSFSACEKYASIDVLQKLVAYSIHHPPNITHNFDVVRLCIMPVKVTLQNCSNGSLVVKLNTVGGNGSSSVANKNQLYSPHSSSSFRWVGLAGSWFELEPHKSECVELSAALGAPGTYDIGSRLEVLCRTPGAPEVDAVSQIWRIESSLVVNSVHSSSSS